MCKKDDNLSKVHIFLNGFDCEYFVARIQLKH